MISFVQSPFEIKVNQSEYNKAAAQRPRYIYK